MDVQESKNFSAIVRKIGPIRSMIMLIRSESQRGFELASLAG